MTGQIVTLQCYGSDLIKRVREQDKKKQYKINLLTGNPISSLLTSPLSVSEELLDKCEFSIEQKNCLLIELNRKASEIIEETNAEYLMIDLMNEITDRYVFSSGNVKSEISNFGNKAFEEAIAQKYPDWKLTTRKCFEISDKEISQIFTGMCSYFKKRFNQKKIIVVECYYADKYIDSADGTIKNYPAAFNVAKVNDYLKKCYNTIHKCLPQCSFIRFPSWTYGSINTVDGINPISLDRSYYKYVSRALDAATGVTPRYTVENIYAEQQIENRQYGRIINSTRVWALEERIKALEKEIDELIHSSL